MYLREYNIPRSIRERGVSMTKTATGASAILAGGIGLAGLGGLALANKYTENRMNDSGFHFNLPGFNKHSPSGNKTKMGDFGGGLGKYTQALKKLEGFSPNVYTDKGGGKPTIGYGFNLSDDEFRNKEIVIGDKKFSFANGLDSQTADEILKYKVSDAYKKAAELYGEGWDKLDEGGRAILADKVYNTGYKGASRKNWPNLYKAIENGDRDGIYNEMLTTYKDPTGRRINLSQRRDTLYNYYYR